ncbi:MAG: Mrp/NBP35 family ATP-binding protein [Spirochaetia bacterium]|jgi:Mrp family chromosome partitioning ATPase|nr:Mrp/NBP35 family ATP-binding protein [Spirochaetia bacterium]
MEETKTENSVIEERLSKVKNKIVVLSGKGGVGKSTFAVNFAASLVQEGFKVGLLDADIHGPSIPTMLGIRNEQPVAEDGVISPVNVDGIKVMSIGFLLMGQDDPVIWRGPMKMNMIKQFLQDVDWGELDYLVIDCPPGTGDEPLSVIQLISDSTGAVVVTTPQEVAASDVRKSLNFCRQLKLDVLGVVENMSGFVCPHCQTVTDIFKKGGGKVMAEKFHVPYLGSIPIDPSIGISGDDGTPFVTRYAGSASHQAFGEIVKNVNKSDKIRK